MQIDLEAQITELKAIITAQSDQISKQGERIAYLEGELQIAEAVSVRYQIDAVGYKAERDKLREACEALRAALKKYPEAATPGVPLHGARTRGIESAYKAIWAALGEGGGG